MSPHFSVLQVNVIDTKQDVVRDVVYTGDDKRSGKISGNFIKLSGKTIKELGIDGTLV